MLSPISTIPAKLLTIPGLPAIMFFPVWAETTLHRAAYKALSNLYLADVSIFTNPALKIYSGVETIAWYFYIITMPPLIVM